MPKISIVIPTYNSENFISSTIESILKQSFKDFELIIIDDHSTDNTIKQIQTCKDERIKLIKRSTNSGSGYIPMTDGVREANGEWVVCVGHDDQIEEDYLQILLEIAEYHSIELCSSTMVSFDKNNKIKGKVPKEDVDFSKIYKAEAAFNLTVPEFKINMNGALVKRTLFLKALDLYKSKEQRGHYDDENLGRILLYLADGMMLSQAKYFYFYAENSITRKFSMKSLGFAKSNEDLLLLAQQFFGKNSKAYENVQIYDFNKFLDMLILFMKNVSCFEDFVSGAEMLYKWHSRINWELAKENNSKKRFKSLTFLFKYFNISLIACSLKYFKLRTIVYCVKYFINKQVF